MITEQHRAQALLHLGATKIKRAETHERGFRIVGESLGQRVARWAYADRGTESHQRRKSAAEDAIAAWQPSLDAWAIVLSGVTGIGKTISAARYVAERGGMLLPAANADRWPFGGGEAYRVAAAASWLLLDDWGDEKTPVGSANLASLLTERERVGLMTVCTTTLTPAAIMARGDHIASRLRKHYVLIDDVQDKRTAVTPSLVGFAREMHLLSMLPALRLLARTGQASKPSALLAECSRLLGVDMDGDAFGRAVGSVSASTEAVGGMLAEISAEMDAAAKAVAL